MYIYIYACNNNKKENMNLKMSTDWIMRWCGGRKWKGEKYLFYNFKNR